MFAFRMNPVDDFLFTPASWIMDDDLMPHFMSITEDTHPSDKLIVNKNKCDKKNKKSSKCPYKCYGLLKRMDEDMSHWNDFGRLDVKENDKEYEVNVDLPGMNKEDIKLSCEEDKLVIEGERKEEKKEEDDNKNIHVSERHFGSFYREMSLPKNVDCSKIGASYENGVLHVIIPKTKEECNKKMITVN